MEVGKHYMKGIFIEWFLPNMKESFLMNTVIKHWQNKIKQKHWDGIL